MSKKKGREILLSKKKERTEIWGPVPGGSSSRPGGLPEAQVMLRVKVKFDTRPESKRSAMAEEASLSSTLEQDLAVFCDSRGRANLGTCWLGWGCDHS